MPVCCVRKSDGIKNMMMSIPAPIWEQDRRALFVSRRIIAGDCEVLHRRRVCSDNVSLDLHRHLSRDDWYSRPSKEGLRGVFQLPVWTLLMGPERTLGSNGHPEHSRRPLQLTSPDPQRHLHIGGGVTAIRSRAITVVFVESRSMPWSGDLVCNGA